MERDELQKTLARLRAELRNGPPLDTGARAQLEGLAHDIEQRLRPDRTEPEALEALAKNLREAIERFEETHPELTAAVNRVADALSRMGI
ncbi:MAG TPA: DUF4404 family protein [Myxococcota bacterium]|nr:DUF4404 family protein [Myxococcota bacterium]